MVEDLTTTPETRLKPGLNALPKTNDYNQFSPAYKGLNIECIEEAYFLGSDESENGPGAGWVQIKRYTGPALLKDLAILQSRGAIKVQFKLIDPKGSRPPAYPDFKISEFLRPKKAKK